MAVKEGRFVLVMAGLNEGTMAFEEGHGFPEHSAEAKGRGSPQDKPAIALMPTILHHHM